MKFTFELLKFVFISLPLAFALYFAAEAYFGLKRLFK